jgi:DNA-binding HxlR family transcriptional regulator
MQRKTFEDQNCSVARCLEAIGEWWTPLILRDMFMGISRFDDFQARLGIARNILTERLNPWSRSAWSRRRVTRNVPSVSTTG